MANQVIIPASQFMYIVHFIITQIHHTHIGRSCQIISDGKSYISFFPKRFDGGNCNTGGLIVPKLKRQEGQDRRKAAVLRTNRIYLLGESSLWAEIALAT
jgi:hypothetical protein